MNVAENLNLKKNANERTYFEDTNYKEMGRRGQGFVGERVGWWNELP